MTIGERIRAAREKKEMTQEELGAICGTTKQSIFKYETGVITNIPLDKIEKIASALGVTPTYLMGWDTEPLTVNQILSRPTTNPSASGKNRRAKPGLGIDDDHLPSNATPFDLPSMHRIPILGRIPAGMPLYAEQNIEGYTLTDLNGGAEYFALRVKGDSMNAARIQDGDILIVRRQEEVENGEIAIVMVGDEDATVKRFYAAKDTVTLMPQSTNPQHQPQIYDLRKTKITVLGKVIKIEVMAV